MENSAIILAGGFSRRLGQDKGLMLLANKPLIKHVLDAIDKVVNEKIVVVSSKTQAESYIRALGSKVKVFVDEGNVQSPLVGALKGFQEAKSEYALLLPCDTPLLSKEILSLLFDLCPNRNAVIPRWPNGYIEPLQAVYRTKPALEAAEKALNEGNLNMQAMVDKLCGIRYVSTLVLRQLDPQLNSFFNVNTPMDLKRAEKMLKEKS
ncbi:MAG: molybdenum cofactor guanylyltransferase [Candidatus Bathyarchaeia archaeon]